MMGTLIVYIPFHLFEEALGNFPAWMHQHHWMSTQLSYGHWMAGNIFFYYPLLLLGIIGYHFGGDKWLPTGLGVTIWGVLNTLEHLIYSCLDRQVSPGLFTGLMFGVIAILTFRRLSEMRKATVKRIMLSLFFACVYALVPVALQIVLSPYFRAIFV